MNNRAAIQELRQIEVQYRAAKSPSMPKAYIVPTAYNDKTSNGLTKCVIDWLRYNSWQAERISNTGRILNKHWIPGTGTNGTADISATIWGRSVKIEVKIGADQQSQYQKGYQESIERAGGVYIIVKDFTTFLFWYRQFIGGFDNGR